MVMSISGPVRYYGGSRVETRSYTVSVGRSILDRRPGNEGNVLAAFDELDEVIQFARSEFGWDYNGMVFVGLNGYTVEGTAVAVTLRFDTFSEVSGMNLLDQIMSKLNSAEALTTDFTLTFTIDHGLVSFDSASGRPNKRFRIFGGGARLVYRGDISEFMNRKRGVVTIPRDGMDCFRRFMLLGLAHLVMKKKEWPRRLDVEQKLCMDIRTFNRLLKKEEPLWCRMLFLLDEWLPAKGVEVDMEMYERELEVDIHLIDLLGGYSVLYPKHFSRRGRPLIIGVVTGRDETVPFNMECMHVDFVSNVGSLHRTRYYNRYCRWCGQFYNCKKHEHLGEKDVPCVRCHTCLDSCQGCGERTLTCFEDTEYVDVCVDCKRMCCSEECLTRVHPHLCQRAGICESCGQEPHPGRKCDEYICWQCKEPVKIRSFEHKCYVQREKLKEPSEKICVYDFECGFDENGVHVPYLCTAWFPYGVPNSVLMERYPHQYADEAGNPVFVFWGFQEEEDGGVFRFFDFIREECLSGTDFYAHNARSYDSILVKHVMLTKFGLGSDDIKRGRKILSMRFASLKIEFKDTISFFPSSLRSLAKDFGIEEFAKGHFPHKYMTVENIRKAKETNYIVQSPERDVFEEDWPAGCESFRDEADRWIEEMMDNPSGQWNMRNEAERYCISDTVLLGKVIRLFRENTMRITAEMERADGVEEVQLLDPFRYVTLPSAVMCFYLSQLLEENTIGVIDRFAYTYRNDAVEWFFICEQETGCTILPDHRLFTARDSHQPDGFCIEMNTAYLFAHCYWRGCRACTKQHGVNSRLGISFGRLNELFRAEIQWYKGRGFQVKVMWLCEWKIARREYRNVLDDNWWELEKRKRLDPRDAYRGGKSECYVHLFKGDIQMADFVSQYPTTLIGTSVNVVDGESLEKWDMPMGHPKVFVKPRRLSSEGKGVAKVIVLPPQHLHVPFLACKVPSAITKSTYEVLYGLCRTCMMCRLNVCIHEPEDRVIMGTWTLDELRYAETLGYTIMAILEEWVYGESSTSLFRKLIVPFMLEKIRSKKKGLLDQNGLYTEAGEKTAAYCKHILKCELKMESIVDNPARRTVAKLMMNAFTGKLGQKEEYESTRIYGVSELDKAIKCLSDHENQLYYMEVLDHEFLSITYGTVEGATKGHLRKNDHVVAHITAYGRMMLHKLEHSLGDNLLYVDTDSAFHMKYEDVGSRPYVTGFRPGDLELELEHGSGWVGLGRKSYAYETRGKAVCKQKGVKLTLRNTKCFSSESLEKLLNPSVQRSITVTQMMFDTVQEGVQFKKRTREVEKRTTFRPDATKRIICWEEATENCIKTRPYGFKYQ